MSSAIGPTTVRAGACETGAGIRLDSSGRVQTLPPFCMQERSLRVCFRILVGRRIADVDMEDLESLLGGGAARNAIGLGPAWPHGKSFRAGPKTGPRCTGLPVNIEHPCASPPDWEVMIEHM